MTPFHGREARFLSWPWLGVRERQLSPVIHSPAVKAAFPLGVR